MKYTGKKFDGDRVTVDFNEYVDCEFNACELIFKGGNVPVFSGCNFSDCSFTLVEKALNTMDYLAFLNKEMAQAGGADFVEAQFAGIKG